MLPTVQGLIRGAFVPREWLPATPEHFPGRENIPERLGFRGEEAPAEVKSLYVGKRVPDKVPEAWADLREEAREEAREEYAQLGLWQAELEPVQRSRNKQRTSSARTLDVAEVPQAR